MNISSVVVCTSLKDSSALQGKLLEMPGVEIHTTTGDGRIVITIEDTPTGNPSETLLAVQNLEGVHSAALVYNYNDDELSQH